LAADDDGLPRHAMGRLEVAWNASLLKPVQGSSALGWCVVVVQHDAVCCDLVTQFIWLSDDSMAE
jgi:hypothetical protein